MRSLVALMYCHHFIILLKMATGSDSDALSYIFTYRYSTSLTHNSRTATQSLFDTY